MILIDLLITIIILYSIYNTRKNIYFYLLMQRLRSNEKYIKTLHKFKKTLYIEFVLLVLFLLKYLFYFL